LPNARLCRICKHMDKNRSELFAHFSYDDSLTYEALLEAEEELTREVELLLQRAGAAHLDFTPMRVSENSYTRSGNGSVGYAPSKD
jgi:hypothetical protein